MNSTQREVRLKTQFAQLYPALKAGVWEPASDVGGRMLVWQLQQAGPVALGQRLFDDRHFEFRGGAARGQTSLRTRVGEADQMAAN